MRRRCVFTVSSEIKSASPISRFESPAATRRMTSRSRALMTDCPTDLDESDGSSTPRPSSARCIAVRGKPIVDDRLEYRKHASAFEGDDGSEPFGFGEPQCAPERAVSRLRLAKLPARYRLQNLDAKELATPGKPFGDRAKLLQPGNYVVAVILVNADANGSKTWEEMRIVHRMVHRLTRLLEPSLRERKLVRRKPEAALSFLEYAQRAHRAGSHASGDRAFDLDRNTVSQSSTAQARRASSA